MTEPQRAEDGEVLVNPSTGMPETRQERDQREQRNQERQQNVASEANAAGDPTAKTDQA